MSVNKETIDALNQFQHWGMFHPLTCGSGRRTDAAHQDGEGILVATLEGWKCPYCDYRQPYGPEVGSLADLVAKRNLFDSGPFSDFLIPSQRTKRTEKTTGT